MSEVCLAAIGRLILLCLCGVSCHWQSTLMLVPQASVKAHRSWRDDIKAEQRHYFTLSDGHFLLRPLTSERNGLWDLTGWDWRSLCSLRRRLQTLLILLFEDTWYLLNTNDWTQEESRWLCSLLTSPTDLSFEGHEEGELLGLTFPIRVRPDAPGLVVYSSDPCSRESPHPYKM